MPRAQSPLTTCAGCGAWPISIRWHTVLHCGACHRPFCWLCIDTTQEPKAALCPACGGPPITREAARFLPILERL